MGFVLIAVIAGSVSGASAWLAGYSLLGSLVAYVAGGHVALLAALAFFVLVSRSARPSRPASPPAEGRITPANLGRGRLYG